MPEGRLTDAAAARRAAEHESSADLAERALVSLERKGLIDVEESSRLRSIPDPIERLRAASRLEAELDTAAPLAEQTIVGMEKKGLISPNQAEAIRNIASPTERLKAAMKFESQIG